MGLGCLNCHEDVTSAEAKVFAQVFLCPSCYQLAERLYTRGSEELKMMLLVLKESIRLAALQGQLRFQDSEGVEDLPREDLLAHLTNLSVKTREQAVPTKDPTWTTPDKTRSRATTPRLAPSVAGKPSSD